MFYMKHRIRSNYHSAAGAGDEKMANDILLSELAKLIVNNPTKVVEILNANLTTKLSDIPGRDKLVKLVSDGIYQSQSFAKAIAAEMIASEIKDFSGDATPPKPTDWAGILNSTSTIVSGLGNLFGGTKKAAAATDKAKADADKARSEAEKALHDKISTIASIKGATSNTGLYIGIVLGVAAILGVTIYFVKFRK
ncbi:MAG: hypothetical protein UV51_C0007G0026 [Candidatus Woesebacteria bacterium GW2011_GWC1_42_9]|nr:MAG: hypothetical protein UV51_C0007G0026 [Candidatus Woesebacteria bacterium GW2011_GWC1_42_9]